jgi:hypothetical protein
MAMNIMCLVAEGEVDNIDKPLNEFRSHPAYQELRAIADKHDIKLRISAHQRGRYVPDWLKKFWGMPKPA